MRKGQAHLNLEQKNISGVILAQKLLNPLITSDDFLSVVLIQRFSEEGSNFAIWTHNAEFDGFSNGYYTNSVEWAFQEFNRRGYHPNTDMMEE